MSDSYRFHGMFLLVSYRGIGTNKGLSEEASPSLSNDDDPRPTNPYERPATGCPLIGIHGVRQSVDARADHFFDETLTSRKRGISGLSLDYRVLAQGIVCSYRGIRELRWS